VVTNSVKTVFSAVTAPFSGPVSKLSSAASTAGSAMGGLMSLVSPLTMALGALGAGGGVSGIISLGSAFENAQLQIGGMLTAIGRTGNMVDGLSTASTIMESIRVAAAALPGEAADYVTVFQTGMTAMDGAIGGTLRETMTFSNAMTAAGATFGLGAQQVGSDINRMLAAGRGQVDTQSVTFNSMLTFMRRSEGQANLTAAAFNNMSAPERLERLRGGLEHLQPMMDAAGNTWDAVSGAFMSNVKEIATKLSAPMFDGMKRALVYVNGLMYDIHGTITPFAAQIIHIGTILGGHVVTGFGKAFEFAKQLFGMVTQIGGSILDSPGFALLATAFSNVGVLVGNIKTAVMGAFGGAEGGMSGVMAALGQSFTSLAGMVLIAQGFLNTTISYLAIPFTMIVDLLTGFLPAALDGVSFLFSGMQRFGASLMSIYSVIFATVRPAFQAIGRAFGALFQVIGAVVGGGFRVLQVVMMMLWSRIKEYVLPVLSILVANISAAFNVVTSAFTRFANWIKRLTGGTPSAAASGGGLSGEFARMLAEASAPAAEAASDEAMNAIAAPGAEPAAAGGRRSGGAPQQTFINSRFTIEQKFEEGFDPDRIATAFAQDLGRVASERLQSSFEPMFAIR